MLWPRRSNVLHFTPAEKAIREATQAVEEAGAHPLLTEAVMLLSDAQSKVADHAELMGAPKEVEIG
jgi:hypothetical protein